MIKSKTRKLYEKAIKSNSADMPNCEYAQIVKNSKELKKIIKECQNIPLYWVKDDNAKSFDHFYDGVVQGYVAGLAAQQECRKLIEEFANWPTFTAADALAMHSMANKLLYRLAYSQKTDKK
jgi:hypothetical protein